MANPYQDIIELSSDEDEMPPRPTRLAPDRSTQQVAIESVVAPNGLKTSSQTFNRNVKPIKPTAKHQLSLGNWFSKLEDIDIVATTSPPAPAPATAALNLEPSGSPDKRPRSPELNPPRPAKRSKPFNATDSKFSVSASPVAPTLESITYRTLDPDFRQSFRDEARNQRVETVTDDEGWRIPIPPSTNRTPSAGLDFNSPHKHRRLNDGVGGTNQATTSSSSSSIAHPIDLTAALWSVPASVSSLAAIPAIIPTLPSSSGTRSWPKRHKRK